MKKVIVYSTNTCPYCFALMDWLDEMGIKYEKRSASEKPDIRAVPVTYVDDIEIVGFDRQGILKALEEK